MSSTEQESPFGDAAATADDLEPGTVVYRDGTTPALVVSVTRADEGEDAAVMIAALDTSTVHVNDLATEYVDPETGPVSRGEVPMPAPGAQSVAVVAEQPPADDPARQTTPTGAPAGGGTATVDAGAAQAAQEGAVDTTNPPPGAESETAMRESDQDARIAELEGRLANAEERARNAEANTAATTPQAEPAPPETVPPAV
jgi:hypothetical protein